MNATGAEHFIAISPKTSRPNSIASRAVIREPLRRVASTDWAAGPWPGAPWDQAFPAGEVSLTLRAFGEDEPGDRIGEHLAAAWPAFREWWREGAVRSVAA